MSGMDVRGHVREGSIARKRAGISSTAPPLSALNSTPSRSPQPPASPLKSYARPAASPRAEDSSGFMRENGFVVKLIAGLVTLLLLGYYGSGMLMERSVRAGGRERKHRLSGTAGEGWVLPRKWREYDAGSRDAQVAEGEVLPVCKRVLLHVFDEFVFPFFSNSTRTEFNIAQSSQFRLRNQSLHPTRRPLDKIRLHSTPRYHFLESRFPPRILPPENDLLSTASRLVLPFLRHSARNEIMAIERPIIRFSKDVECG